MPERGIVGRLHAEPRANQDGESRDTVQMFAVLCALATDLPDQQRALLQAILVAHDFDTVGRDCMEPFVRLSGIEGLGVCLDSFGECIGRTDWNDDWSFLALLDTLAERDGPALAEAVCRDACSRSLKFDLAFRRLERRRLRAKQGVSCAPAGNPATDRLSRINRIPSEWGKTAVPQDLAWAASELLQSLAGSDIQSTLTLLRVFWKRDFPGPITKLLDAITGESRKIANAAVWVLRRVRHTEIRALALTLIAAGDHARGVRLLESNIRRGDIALIDGALCTAQADEDTYHSVGCATLDLLEHDIEAVTEAEPLLLHLYTHGPCSFCRERAISFLETLRAVPSWMAAECRYDCVQSVAARFTVAA